jgi:hypothetical protein
MAAQRLGRTACSVGTLLCVCWLLAPRAGAAEGGLELRAVRDGRVAEAGSAVPAEAVRVFVYEGMPGDVVVTDDVIAVDYGVSGVLFDRTSGEPVERFTVADGWPAVRAEPFRPLDSPAARREATFLVGPGALYGRWQDDVVAPAVAASVTFEGHEWRAMQPAGFLRRLRLIRDLDERRRWEAWTPILRAINDLSYVEMAAITMSAVSDSPVAEDDACAVDEDNTLSVSPPGVLTNDSDPDGDTLTVNTTPVTDVAGGTLTLYADGAFDYTPDPDVYGTDSFVYEVSNRNGGTDTATVTITVNPVNDPPVAADDGYSVDEDRSLVVAAPGGTAVRRFTMDDGLASNIVSHLVVAQGSLWAACVDIYDPQREQWGPGGLCRFDPRTMRWQRVDRVDGRPVRWVTLLQNVDGELWVGFREGSGVEGDRISYWKGTSAGHYRPQVTALVLARLTGKKWASFARPPRPEPVRLLGDPPPEKPPTEKPYRLTVSGGKILLATHNASVAYSYGWDRRQDVHVSLLDEATGEWRDLDDYEHFAADQLLDMFAQDGEVVVRSNRGAHRWDAAAGTWQFLDPGCTLLNPNMSAAVAVGDEFWVGYTNQSFGVVGEQGISRFHERTGRWSHVLPDEIGTACPVRAIVPLLRGGTWVLFRPRPLTQQAVESPRHAREMQVPRPTGLGRFSDGRWEFPVALPQAAEEAAPRKMFISHSHAAHLAAVGDTLVFGDRTGLYTRPPGWRQVAAGPVLAVEPSPDGRGLSVTRAVLGGDPDGEREVQRARYAGGRGAIQFETVAASSVGWRAWALHGYLLREPADGKWAHSWVRIPVAKDGLWVIGPLGGEYHAVVETPRAVWIASQGELIRLDRRLLARSRLTAAVGAGAAALAGLLAVAAVLGGRRKAAGPAGGPVAGAAASLGT